MIFAEGVCVERSLYLDVVHELQWLLRRIKDRFNLDLVPLSLHAASPVSRSTNGPWGVTAYWVGGMVGAQPSFQSISTNCF
jgi:hypothetical protein